jgi:hypothetical protein
MGLKAATGSRRYARDTAYRAFFAMPLDAVKRPDLLKRIALHMRVPLSVSDKTSAGSLGYGPAVLLNGRLARQS